MQLSTIYLEFRLQPRLDTKHNCLGRLLQPAPLRIQINCSTAVETLWKLDALQLWSNMDEDGRYGHLGY